MGRRKRYDVRCLECQMRKELCICSEVIACRNTIQNQTRIVILMHQRERVRTTNTARLAERALRHCEIRLRGLQDAPLSTEGILDPDRHTFLLYPSDEATELTPTLAASLHKPVTLIVPDGTWSQARRIPKREPTLQSVPHIKLGPGQMSRYGLRRNPQPNGIATFEAIARSLGILEGPQIQLQLEQLFDLMVTKTFSSRGIRPDTISL